MTQTASGPLYGLIEGGGTKFVAGIARSPTAILATTRITTTSPEETLRAVAMWLAHAADGEPLAAVGIACFGPLILDPDRDDWGQIRRTSKRGWSGTDLASPFAARFDCAVHIDTDVNAAALAEYRWGAGQGCRSMVYLTVGTGIGGGAVIDGRLVYGSGHPEMGHMRIARHADDSTFVGVCPVHGDCLEGLASGSAIQERWGDTLSSFSPAHPAHAIIAWYIGQGVVNIQAMLAPDRIVIGGGVMATAGLRVRIADAAQTLGAGYFTGDVCDILVKPELGDRAGLLGALAVIGLS